MTHPPAQATLPASFASDAPDARDAPSMSKLWWRIMPLMMAGLFLNVLDRYNISFAALRMNADLGLSNTVFGLGAGFLAVGMLIFGIPSTIVLHKVGARRWISVTLVIWGFCSAATAFVSNATELCIARLLLGAAEAGFVPGSILYFSQWFPTEYRGRVLGSFLSLLTAIAFYSISVWVSGDAIVDTILSGDASRLETVSGDVTMNLTFPAVTGGTISARSISGDANVSPPFRSVAKRTT